MAGRSAFSSSLLTGNLPHDAAFAGHDTADPAVRIVAADGEDVLVDELRQQSAACCRAGRRISVGDVGATWLVEQHRVDRGVRDQDGALALGLDPQAHVAGKVSRQRKSRDALGDVDLPVDLLELDGEDRPFDVRTAAVPGERDPVAMRDIAGVRKDDRALPVGVPADVVDVEVREEDDVHVLGRGARLGERGKQALLELRVPAPEAGRADAGVDEHRALTGAKKIGGTRDPPARLREDCRIELAVRRPIGGVGKELRQLPQLAHRVDERHELDGADYHLTRSGGGSPCASCQPITGLRRTPIRSISASITSPGFR